MLALIWLVVCATFIFLGWRHARHGEATLRRIRDRHDVAALIGDDSGLRSAERDFAQASSELNSPLLWPIRLVPVIGRQIRAAAALSRAARETVDAGAHVVDAFHSATGRTLPSGPARASLLRAISNAATDAHRRVGKVNLGPREGLVGPLVDARNELASNLANADELLVKASTTSDALARLLDGPSDYLLLAANNSEMRAGSGMYLQAGAVTLAAGRVDVSEMRPTQTLRLPEGAVAVPNSYDRLWGFLRPGEEWRNVNASPRFDATAPLAASMWSAVGQRPVQGVVEVDPFALKAVLAAIGPVTLDDGSTVDSTNVVKLLLNEQYTGVQAEDTQNDLRRERLRVITRAVVSTLGERSPDAVTLFRGMLDAVHGRHLMVWSADDSTEKIWRSVGVAGEVPANALGVTLLNRGVNKLDYFTDVGVAVDIGPPENGQQALTLSITITNHTPSGQAGYVAGPVSDVTSAYGDYKGVVAITLPGSASSTTIDGVSQLTSEGPDGATYVIAAPVFIRMGESTTLVARAKVPAASAVRLQPSARPRQEHWTIGDRSLTDDRAHTIQLR